MIRNYACVPVAAATAPLVLVSVFAADPVGDPHKPSPLLCYPAGTGQGLQPLPPKGAACPATANSQVYAQGWVREWGYQACVPADYPSLGPFMKAHVTLWRAELTQPCSVFRTIPAAALLAFQPKTHLDANSRHHISLYTCCLT